MNSDPPPRVVIKNSSVREAAITVVCVILAVGALVFGVTQLRKTPEGNTLTGEVVAKVFTPLKEEIVEFNRNHLKATRESEGEFVLKVRVDQEGGRVFEVPVSKAVYISKKEGDSLTFIRPQSEQK